MNQIIQTIFRAFRQATETSIGRLKAIGVNIPFPMKQYYDIHHHLITDAYIRLTFIKDPSLLDGIFKLECILTNIEDPFAFRTDLVEQENRSPKNKGKESTYGVVVSFLLDKEKNSDRVSIDKLTKEIVKRYEDLPFYCFLTKKGEGVFINVYVCERHYDPEGMKIQVKASKDLYISSKTKKRCRPDDENAVLFKREGEVIRETSSKFSSKVSTFRFASERQFLLCMTNLKKWFIEIYQKVLDIVIRTGISFKKFVLSKLEYKKAAKVFNTALVDMEEMFNRYYEHLEGISDELNGQISPKLRGEMESLVSMIQTKIRNDDSFVYGIPFNLNLSSTPDVALMEADLLKAYFEARLLKIGQQFFYSVTG